nr:DUF3168 domain-containing protein [uncultured Oscillibacter sp.]
MQPDEMVKAALSRLPGLEVFPLEGLKNAEAPFVFYLQAQGDEETALDGLTGLRSASFEINCVARSYGELKALANRVRPALQSLQGAELEGLSVQRAKVRQASPDLLEREVRLFRRMYILELDYQEE